MGSIESQKVIGQLESLKIGDSFFCEYENLIETHTLAKKWGKRQVPPRDFVVKSGNPASNYRCIRVS